MNLVELIKGINSQFISDEKLLRLLYYVPENQLDSPLDPNKPNILDMDIEQYSDIVDNTIYAMDKKFKLDLESKFARINFYLNSRTAERAYSRGAGRLINNPLVSRQEIVIDIHTNIEIEKVDFRSYQIIERIHRLLDGKNFKQFTGIKFDNGYTIMNTPDGFVGYRLIYYVISSQGIGCEC